MRLEINQRLLHLISYARTEWVPSEGLVRLINQSAALRDIDFEQHRRLAIKATQQQRHELDVYRLINEILALIDENPALNEEQRALTSDWFWRAYTKHSAELAQIPVDWILKNRA